MHKVFTEVTWNDKEEVWHLTILLFHGLHTKLSKPCLIFQILLILRTTSFLLSLFPSTLCLLAPTLDFLDLYLGFSILSFSFLRQSSVVL